MTDIKTLNDNFRRTFSGGRVLLTTGIRAFNNADIVKILHEVRYFHNFNESNDPYHEHDYGKFNYNGNDIMWKIDYYDKNMEFVSENPADETITNRVMTIMLAEEY